HADEFLGDIDGEVLDRFHQFASFFVVLGDDLRFADHQFVTFAAHHLDQDGKLQLAAAQNLERVGAPRLFHAQRDVGEQLFFQALTQVARGDVGAFASAKRRRVDGEEHGNRRLVDDDGGEGRGILGVGNGFANGDAFDSGDGNDVAQRSFRDVGALEAGEAEELGDFCFVKGAVALGDGNIFARLHGSIKNASDGEAAEIVAVVEIRDQDLKRAVGVSLRSRDGVNDGFKQQTQVLARRSLMNGGGACLGIGIEDGEVELLFLGVEIDKEVVNFVENFLRAGVGTVDLVDDENRLQVRLERLAEHVASLRQRAFAGIYQQHDSVDHLEGAFDFAAKIGVAGRVHDIDFYAGIKHSRILGKNSDAALAFQIVRVHDALGHGLVVAEGATLSKHGVNQRGFAVVHVGNDGDVADAWIQFENSSGFRLGLTTTLLWPKLWGIERGERRDRGCL